MSKSDSFQNDVTIEDDGKRYTLTVAELRRCAATENEWLPAGDWSSWMFASVYGAARATGAPKPVARALTAQALGVTVDKVNSSLEWHVNYMRFHDGDPDYDLD